MKWVKLVNVENGYCIELVPLFKWEKVAFAQDGLKPFSNGQIAAQVLDRPELAEKYLDAIIVDTNNKKY